MLSTNQIAEIFVCILLGQQLHTYTCIAIIRLIFPLKMYVTAECHPRLLPKKNFKEPTRPNIKKLGAQHVKC